MTTSGISTLSFSRDQIIYAALRKCGMAAEGETPSATMVSNAADDLNRLVKGFQADGVKLWTYDELVLLLDSTKNTYMLGPGGDPCIQASALVPLSLTADAAASATHITVASATGVSSGNFIALRLDDGSLAKTTVSGAPSGNVITLTAPLASQASSGALAWAYAALAPRPLRVEGARIQTGTNSEIEMLMRSRADYFRIPNKEETGTPVQYYYNPTLGTGTFYIWPQPDVDALWINLTSYRPFQIFNTSTDTADMPDECYQALIWNLAMEIGPEYGLDAPTLAVIQQRAESWLSKVEMFDVEEASLIFMPDFR